MKRFYFILFYFTSIHLFAQFSREQELVIDSLKVIINSTKHDTIKIQAYATWDDIIYASNPQLDEELNQKIVEISKQNIQNKTLFALEKIAFNKAMSKALNSLGIIYYNKGVYDKAINFYVRSLKIREIIDDKKGIAATLNNLGIVYQDQAEYDTAIVYYTKSLKLNEEIGDKKGQANCLSNMGRIFFDQNELDKAIDYQEQSLKLRQSIGDKEGVAIAYTNIGSIYLEKNNTPMALEFFEKVLEISQEMGNKNKEALALANIGTVYKKRKNVLQAFDYFNRSIKLFEEVGNKKWEASLHNYLGELYNLNGEDAKAVDEYKKALAIGKEVGAVGMIRDASQSLFGYYKLKENYKDALPMYELYIQMRDSILNEKNQKKILQKEFKYKFEQEKVLNEQQREKDKEIGFERERVQKTTIYAVTSCFALLIVFTIFVFNRLYITRKQKRVIEIQKNLVEEKQKEVLASITYAKSLQDAILPTSHYVKAQFPESFIFYKPKDIVAGDFYWMERKGDLLFIAVADCTGHGVPGAMVSVICSNALNRALIEFGITTPGKILDKARELVLETFSRSEQDVKDGMDISLMCINEKYNEVKWSGANTPLWYFSNGVINEVRANKQAIGKTDSPTPFSTHVINYNKGDIFYLFSDGFADQFGGPQEKKFKTKNLKELLLQNADKPMELQKQICEDTFTAWTGDLEQIDDVSLIGIKI